MASCFETFRYVGVNMVKNELLALLVSYKYPGENYKTRSLSCVFTFAPANVQMTFNAHNH